jgi:hypothetical protein
MGFNNERDKQAYDAWKKQDDIEQQKLTEKLMAPIRAQKAKEEFERTANAAFTQARKLALYGNTDRVFVSPRVLGIIRGTEPMTEEQMNSFADAEARAFKDENPDFAQYNNAANIDIIISMYSERDFPVCCRDMLKSAFLILKRDGLLEPNPIPVQRTVAPVQSDNIEPDWDAIPRLPIDHKTPIAYKRQDTEQTFTGTDPLTGKPITLTARQVDLLSAAEYKAIFHVPNMHLGKYSFGGGR